MELAIKLTELEHHPDAVAGAVALWADARTDPGSGRRLDLLRDKQNAVNDFFAYVGKHPAQVTPPDVRAWQAELETRELAPATVYAKISRVSSFYEWAMESPELAQIIRSNPVKLARPKAPKAYQNAWTQWTKRPSHPDCLYRT
jgi:hypothetical protein